MKAVIIAGGLGTRLRPLTRIRPKPMLPSLNKPMLAHVLDWLRHYGFFQVIITAQYLAEQIQTHFGDGHRLGMSIDYVLEETPLGTAGGVKMAQLYLNNETFVVVSGYIVSNLDLSSLVRFHRDRQAVATLGLKQVTDPLEYGLVGEGEPSIMKEPPRDPQEPIMTRRHWYEIGGYGLLITMAVLGALALALLWLGMGTEQAVTVSFLTLAIAQLWHVFNMRDSNSSLLRNEITGNPYVWGALALCTGLLLATVYLPGLADVFQVVNPGLNGWELVIGMSLLPAIDYRSNREAYRQGSLTLSQELCR